MAGGMSYERRRGDPVLRGSALVLPNAQGKAPLARSPSARIVPALHGAELAVFLGPSELLREIEASQTRREAWATLFSESTRAGHSRGASPRTFT